MHLAFIMAQLEFGKMQKQSVRNLATRVFRLTKDRARLYQAAKPRLNRAATIYPPTLTILQGHALEVTSVEKVQLKQN